MRWTGAEPAQKVLVQLIDDLDGTAAEDVEAVSFGLGGVTAHADRRTGGRRRLGPTPAARRCAAPRHHALAADLLSLPDEPVVVHVFTGQSGHRVRGVELLEGREMFCAELDDQVVAVLSGEITEGVTGLRGGASEPGGYGQSGRAHRQAVQAAESAHTGKLARFGDVMGGGMLGLLRPTDAQEYALSLLAPIVEHDRTGRGDLVVSLTEWLRQHGQWDPAARRLGVHPHTFRNRIGKIAELTGRHIPRMSQEVHRGRPDRPHWICDRLMSDPDGGHDRNRGRHDRAGQDQQC